MILCVNKWDAAPDKDRKAFLEKVRDALKFLDYAPVAFLSAKTGAGVRQLFPLIREVYAAASQRISTGELNRFAEGLHFEPRREGSLSHAGFRAPANFRALHGPSRANCTSPPSGSSSID